MRASIVLHYNRLYSSSAFNKYRSTCRIFNKSSCKDIILSVSEVKLNTQRYSSTIRNYIAKGPYQSRGLRYKKCSSNKQNNQNQQMQRIEYLLPSQKRIYSSRRQSSSSTSSKNTIEGNQGNRRSTKTEGIKWEDTPEAKKRADNVDKWLYRLRIFGYVMVPVAIPMAYIYFVRADINFRKMMEEYWLDSVKWIRQNIGFEEDMVSYQKILEQEYLSDKKIRLMVTYVVESEKLTNRKEITTKLNPDTPIINETSVCLEVDGHKHVKDILSSLNDMSSSNGISNTGDHIKILSMTILDDDQSENIIPREGKGEGINSTKGHAQTLSLSASAPSELSYDVFNKYYQVDTTDRHYQHQNHYNNLLSRIPNYIKTHIDSNFLNSASPSDAMSSVPSNLQYSLPCLWTSQNPITEKAKQKEYNEQNRDKIRVQVLLNGIKGCDYLIAQYKAETSTGSTRSLEQIEEDVLYLRKKKEMLRTQLPLHTRILTSLYLV